MPVSGFVWKKLCKRGLSYAYPVFLGGLENSSIWICGVPFVCGVFVVCLAFCLFGWLVGFLFFFSFYFICFGCVSCFPQGDISHTCWSGQKLWHVSVKLLITLLQSMGSLCYMIELMRQSLARGVILILSCSPCLLPPLPHGCAAQQALICELVPKGLIPSQQNQGGYALRGEENEVRKAVLVPDPTAILFEALISSKILAVGLLQAGIRNTNVTDLGYTH